MSQSTADLDDDVALYMAQVERVCEQDARLSSLAGGILAAIDLDIAHDSRSFARMFGIEHALVLREVQILVDLGRLSLIGRDERTQRCSYVADALHPAHLVAGNDPR